MKKITTFIFTSLLSVMCLSAAPTTGLQFAGTAPSIIALNPQAAFSPTQFTIEVWANYQTLNGGGYILSTEGWSPTNHGFSLRLWGSRLEFAIGDGSNWPSIHSSTDLTVNTWFHAAVTCSGNQIKLYINGVEDATATITTPMVASTEKITIGDSPAWSGRLFVGKMADLRFWNVLRTPTEIAADMSSTITGTESGLVAGWRMNEGTGTTVADVKDSYNITKPADVAWFGTVSGVSSVYDNSTNIESLVYDRTIEVSNKTNGKLQLSVYSITGQKLMECSVKASDKFQKQLSVARGSYVLRCVAEDGSTYTKEFIITE